MKPLKPLRQIVFVTKRRLVNISTTFDIVFHLFFVYPKLSTFTKKKNLKYANTFNKEHQIWQYSNSEKTGKRVGKWKLMKTIDTKKMIKLKILYAQYVRAVSIESNVK